MSSSTPRSPPTYTPVEVFHAVLPEMIERGDGAVLMGTGYSAVEAMPHASGPGFILDTLRRLREEGLSRSLVEQNAKLPFDAISHCLVIGDGSVAMTGTSEELSRAT
ncbi:hypothetical protein ACWC09_18370 [Streptomyces sp. NPDC001617]